MRYVNWSKGLGDLGVVEGTPLWENLRRAFWSLPVFCETRSGYYLSLLLRWRKCERIDRLESWDSPEYRALAYGDDPVVATQAEMRDRAKLARLRGEAR